ncbi:unnamed protein product, partial [Meganyctiphanes norvegica]
KMVKILMILASLAALLPATVYGSIMESLVEGLASNWGRNLDTNFAAAAANQSLVARSFNSRSLIAFPPDSALEFYFKLVVPHWTYGNAKAKGDYRFEISIDLPEPETRKKRSLAKERNTMYNIIADFMNKSGMDGNSCVLRAICEVAEAPLAEFGIYGEFLNLIFSPGFRAEKQFETHLEAEDYGRTQGNCWAAFPQCPMSMRDHLHDFFLNNADVSEGDCNSKTGGTKLSSVEDVSHVHDNSV